MKRFLSVLLIALCLVAFVSPAHAFHGVRMTYAASGSSGITVADNDNIDFGTNNFTLRWKGSLPDWTPASFKLLMYKKASGGGNPGIGFYVDTTGKLGVQLKDTVWDSTVATGLIDGVGAEIVAVITVGGVNTTVDFYINGIALGTQVSKANVGTVSNAEILYILGTSGYRNASTNHAVTTFNRALSAAEVLSLYQSGIADADKWGSQTAVYTSDFSAGVDGWTAYQGAVAGNIDTIGGADDWLRFTCNTTSSGHKLIKSSLFTVGRRYRVTLTYYIPSGQSNIDSILLADSGNNPIGSRVTTTDSATTITQDFTALDTGLSVIAYDGTTPSFADAGGDDVFYIKNVVITQIGATLALEPSGIGATGWTDASSNGLNASYPTDGYSLFYNGQRNLLGVGQ